MSEIELTREQQKAVNAAANTEEISAILHDAMESSTEKTHTNEAAKTVADVVDPATTYKRIETIGGREFEFEADSETELNQMIVNAYRVASAVTESEPQIVAEPAEDPGVAAMRKVDLELKFKRGEISASDYLEQSGAVADLNPASVNMTA